MSGTIPPQLPQQPPPLPPNLLKTPPNPQYRYTPPRRKASSDKTLAVTSLILGIVGLLGSSCFVGLFFAVAGILVGIFHLKGQTEARPVAWTGIALSTVACFVAVASMIFFSSLLGDMFGNMNQDMESHFFAEWEGVRAPDFDVVSDQGTKLKLSELRGQRVVVCVFEFMLTGQKQMIDDINTLATELTGSTTFIVINEGVASLPSVDKNGNPSKIQVVSSNMPVPYGDGALDTTLFFIERQGVIDHVIERKRSIEKLRKLATAPDYSWKVKEDPDDPEPELTESPSPLALKEMWRLPLSEAASLSIGDLNQDGSNDICVVNSDGKLTAYDPDGKPVHSIRLAGISVFGMRALGVQGVAMPRLESQVEFGTHKTGPRLLVYESLNGGVQILDMKGKELWSKGGFMGSGSAHWGDLDGDGSDEVTIATDGFGSIEACSAEGKSLWKDRIMGPMFSVAILPAYGNRKGYVFTPGMGESVRVYAHDGKQLDSISSGGLYVRNVEAAQLDAAGLAQIVVFGKDFDPDRGMVVAYDPDGNKAWSASVDSNLDFIRQINVCCGDADGDGVKDWVFPDATGDLIIVSHDGTKLGTLQISGSFDRIEILPRPGATSLLVALSRSSIIAYSLESASELPHEESSQEAKQDAPTP
ncbi:MAG: PQQ-binding-like beta-propeller repeat protein [Candidatus Hydrogenedentes bacterium]|nr:PQQ-binding-like beta-propeller repeat protein [Candidatus Hydrogenedentota bacterium]